MQNQHFLKSFIFSILFLSFISYGFSAEVDTGAISEPDTITTNAANSVTDKADYSEVIIWNKSYHTFASPNLPETTVSTEYVDGKPVGNVITKTIGENGEVLVEVKDKDGKLYLARSWADGNFTGDATAVTAAQEIKKALEWNKNTTSQSFPYIMGISLFLVIFIFVFIIKAIISARKSKDDSDKS